MIETKFNIQKHTSYGSLGLQHVVVFMKTNEHATIIDCLYKKNTCGRVFYYEDNTCLSDEEKRIFENWLEADLNPKCTNSAELEEYIIQEYRKYDVELSSLFFDIPVSMPKKDILKAYANLQKTINGDSVVRLINIKIDNDGNTLGDIAKDFIPEKMYDDIYTGNCKDFLESFNGKERETGFCRYDDEYLLDFIF